MFVYLCVCAFVCFCVFEFFCLCVCVFVCLCARELVQLYKSVCRSVGWLVCQLVMLLLFSLLRATVAIYLALLTSVLRKYIIERENQ